MVKSTLTRVFKTDKKEFAVLMLRIIANQFLPLKTALCTTTKSINKVIIVVF